MGWGGSSLVRHFPSAPVAGVGFPEHHKTKTGRLDTAAHTCNIQHIRDGGVWGIAEEFEANEG